MKFEVKGNRNYCGTIINIKNLMPLENCDNVVSTNIFGNNVIISKNIKIGDIGLFFPVETKLSAIFLKSTNLYRDKELNDDKTKSGFFESHGRIKCMKFRGHKSEGFWIPVDCLVTFIPEIFVRSDKQLVDFIGIEFDHINEIKICEKYFIETRFEHNKKQKNNNRLNRRLKKFDRIIDGMFKFHITTPQLGKEIIKINLLDILSITLKCHGTSFIGSYIPCKRKLKCWEEIDK